MTDEIAVTPQMVSAGMEELRQHNLGEDWEYVLESVYRAMAYEVDEAVNPVPAGAEIQRLRGIINRMPCTGERCDGSEYDCPSCCAQYEICEHQLDENDVKEYGGGQCRMCVRYIDVRPANSS